MLGNLCAYFFPFHTENVFFDMGEREQEVKLYDGYINRGDTINGLSFVGVKSYINDTEIW